MKKVVIRGEREAALVDAPDPRPKEDWAVIKVHAAPMCTEYKAFLAGTPSAFLGHEAAGEVVDVARPGRVKVGDRVVAVPLDGCGRCDLCVAGDYLIWGGGEPMGASARPSGRWAWPTPRRGWHEGDRHPVWEL